MVDLYFCAVESHWKEHSVETGMNGWFSFRPWWRCDLRITLVLCQSITLEISLDPPVSPRATTNYCVTRMLKIMSTFRSTDNWDRVKHDGSWGNLQESAHLWRPGKEIILTLFTGHILLPRSSQLGYICLQPGHTANSCWLVRPGPSSRVLKQKLQKLEYLPYIYHSYS